MQHAAAASDISYDYHNEGSGYMFSYSNPKPDTSTWAPHVYPRTKPWTFVMIIVANVPALGYKFSGHRLIESGLILSSSVH